MNEIKALLVDDEMKSRSVLKKLLQNFCPQVTVCGEASNTSDAYEMIIDLAPKVVFLDIRMPNEKGFALLKKFSEVPFEVIFVTSYDQYAIEALRFSALDYLLKPVEVSALLQAVARLEANLEKKSNYQKQIVNLVVQLENKELEKKVVVHSNDLVVLLPLGEITCLEAERNYTRIHTSAGGNYTSTKNLGEFEELLESYPCFLRISKSAIVHLGHIEHYSKGEPCIITLRGDRSHEVSRRKKQEVLERLKEKRI